MTVASAEEFFAVLEKSKLLLPSQLAQARGIVGPNDAPKTVAKQLVRHRFITRWQAGQLLAGRGLFHLGKYRLIELLGRGGMGSVFLGEHVTMNRRVALKIVSRTVSHDPAMLRRFLADARAIAALDHPNILQVYSVDSEGERYYLVLEYVDGVDLQRLVEEEGPLESHRAADYVRQIADGLDHAHQQGIIHRDIRPSKLLVNAQGVVKIIDMGLAWLAGDRANGSSTGDRPDEYLAPEEMKNAEADCRADVYSLGCTLYFLLTGHPPFPHGAMVGRTVDRQTEELPDLRVERPRVPEELAAICRRMAAVRPEDRYPTAAEASRALAEWIAMTPPVERPIQLPRAKPLDEFDTGSFSGINFADVLGRREADKRNGDYAVNTDANVMATSRAPSRQWVIVGVVAASLLTILAGITVVAVLWR